MWSLWCKTYYSITQVRERLEHLRFIFWDCGQFVWKNQNKVLIFLPAADVIFFDSQKYHYDTSDCQMMILLTVDDASGRLRKKNLRCPEEGLRQPPSINQDWVVVFPWNLVQRHFVQRRTSLKIFFPKFSLFRWWRHKQFCNMSKIGRNRGKWAIF